MLNYSTVPLSLWTHELKNVVYLLNIVPKVKVYNPYEKKLDARTISGFFISYPEKSKDNVQVTNEQVIKEEQEIAPRRYERQIRPTILRDYVVYSLECECEFSIDEDLVSFIHAMKSDNSEKWLNTMKEELKSIDDNKV
ncbi:hypothetical protein CR513_56580, partial [Mucuna pruriens]